MENSAHQQEIQPGSEVFGSDGDKIGKVISVHPTYIVIEKGFFFPTDYFIPVEAVAGHDDHNVFLNVTKDQAMNQGWNIAPGESTATGAPAQDDMPSSMGAAAAADAAAGAAAGAGLTDDENESEHVQGFEGDRPEDRTRFPD